MSCAERPGFGRTQGMPREGPATLLASVSFSRTPGRDLNQRPMMVSVAPKVASRAGTAYISAVSKKSTPRSTALSMMRWAWASSTCSPNVMVPRQMGLTRRASWRRSLCPSVTGFMDRR